ncbi:MAG: CsbD family protein [Bacteroidota bacterium]
MDATPKRNVLEGKWKRVRGKLKEQWGKLTDSQLDQVHGRYDDLVGLLQENYGYTTDKAREELDKFIERVAASA